MYYDDFSMQLNNGINFDDELFNVQILHNPWLDWNLPQASINPISLIVFPSVDVF